MKKDVVKYTINEAEIAKMSDIYMKLTIDGLEDTEGFAAVHFAKMVMVKHRTLIDKLRKTTNSDAQTFIRTNNANAKKLLDLMEPIEAHLKDEESKITKEKERIKAEEERLEKIKIEDRVTALFSIGVNIPYFEAAMLSDEEYEIGLDMATNKHNIERLRLQEELKAKEEEQAKLEIERAEIERVKKEQEAKAKEQADKEKAIAAELKAIEDEKKAEADRKEREAFEKQAMEDAQSQAEKDAAETEKARKANEKADREAKEQETKEARFESLKEIGFKYPFNDLGIMPDKQYDRLYKSHRKVWDIKQQGIFIEKLEKERVEKEKADAAEKKRQSALLPDKEKLFALADTINGIILPGLKSTEAQKITANVSHELSAIAINIAKQAKELK